MTTTGGKGLRLLVVVCALAGLSLSCAETKPNFVVAMRDFALEIQPTIADEGNVLIDIDNAGAQQHELVIVRGEDPDALAVTPEGRVDLTTALVVDQVKPFPPGRFRVMTPDIRYGDYVVFCNLISAGADGRQVGHFARGMRDTFTIRQFEPNAEGQ